MITKILKSIFLGMIFSTLAAFCALASESVTVSGNTITYKIDVTGCGSGKSVNLYVLMNGATVDVRGSQASNYTPRSNHLVKSQFIDMSAAIGNNTKNKANPSWYTTNASGTRTLGTFCSSISYSYTLSGGRLIATVTIVNPIKEVTGICFVKLSSSGKDTYYDKIAGGEKDISTAVLKARGEYVETTKASNAAEEAKKKAEEEAKKKAEEEAKKKAEEEAKKKAEEEAKKKAEEEARKKAEEEAKKKAEEEARKQAEEEARKKAAEEESRRAAEEEARKKAEEEAKKNEEKAKKAGEISDIKDRIRSGGSESAKVKDTEIPCKKLKQFAKAFANLF